MYSITKGAITTCLVLLAHGALTAHAGPESCDGRVASLEREIVRLNEQLSRCLVARANFSIAVTNTSAPALGTSQALALSDGPTTNGLPRRKHRATARLLLQQARAGQFSLGQAQTNDCTVGFSPLGSAAMCKAAAAQFNLTFQGPEEVADYPKGCYAYPGEGVYFNMHRTGAAELISMPVCADNSFVSEQSSFNTPATSLTVDRFIQGEHNTNICRPGSMAIETVPECKRAAETLLFLYGSQANTPRFPKGCYVQGSRHTTSVYFNFDAKGSAEFSAAPLCRDVSTPSPTPDGQTMTPTVAPSAAPARKYVLVGDGACRGRSRSGFEDRVNARMKLMPDEAACVDACELLGCDGYAYAHNGIYTNTCWVYGEKVELGLPPWSSELATAEWQGVPQEGTTITSSSGASSARCMLRGTHNDFAI